ncbi:MAG: glycosyltransferase family 4 protein [Candidatus Helarchaeota archaeon]
MGSPGKVLIIVQNLPVPFDRRVWLEACALRDVGYDVSVISIKGKNGNYSEDFIVIDGINVYRYNTPSEARGTLGYIIEFVYCWLATANLSIKVLQNHGFDILHACNPPDTYFLLGLIYKRLLGKRFIFDHHDLSPEMYVAKGGREKGFLHKGLLFLEKMTFKTADIVITTNESHKDIANKRGGVDSQRIFVVRSGPDFDRLQIRSLNPELKQGFKFLSCYLGEMCSQDGVDGLLRSISIYVNEINRKDTLFVFLGGGPELDYLINLKNKMNLQDYVVFLGRVSDIDLCRYLSTADLCLDPDPYTEWSNQSTMNKIMEYMFFGKPILAYDLKENRFSAQDAAMYVTPNKEGDFAHGIQYLLDRPNLREKMGKFGRKRVLEKLLWNYSIPNLVRAYEMMSNSIESKK